MVKISVELLPPLEHPKSEEVPAGVCTWTVYFPGAETIDEVIVTSSCVSLTTVVETVLPLNMTTDEETK